MGRIRYLFAAGARQYKPVVVTVDGEAHTLFVGKVTVSQRERFIRLLETDGLTRAQAFLVQHCAYEDESGERAFGDAQEDTDAILAAPMQFVHAIAEEVMRFNALAGTEDPVKAAAKN